MIDFKPFDILLVSGLPRSGTSLMMNVLGKGGVKLFIDNVREANIDNPKGYFEEQRVKKLNEDNSWLDEAEGKALKVVSPLLPFLDLNYSYLVIFMRRDINEIILSQKKMRTRRGVSISSSDDEEIKDTLEESLAFTDLWLEGKNNIKKVDIFYKDLVNNPTQSLKPIDNIIKNFNLRASVKVIDQSLYRNRSK